MTEIMMEDNKLHVEIHHIERPVIVCWRVPPFIGRLKAQMTKFKGNGFFAVISISLLMG
jgi:hypothetical protein